MPLSHTWSNCRAEFNEFFFIPSISMKGRGGANTFYVDINMHARNLDFNCTQQCGAHLAQPEQFSR